jgi:hypothetical protein
VSPLVRGRWGTPWKRSQGGKGRPEIIVVPLHSPIDKKEVIEAVSGLEPVGQEHLPIKKFAVLDLMLEAEAQGKRAEDIVLAKELIEQKVKKLRDLPDLG